MTQEALAARLGVNRTTVLNMEAGRNPALNRWADAMSLLGYDVVVVPRGARVMVVEPDPVDDQAGDRSSTPASEAAG